MTGFGAGGPLSHKHGFDGIGQAMSGAVFLSGFAEQPIMTKVPWVDFGTAFLSAFGTLAALIERGKTGSGQKVEGALLRTATAIANAMLIEQSLTGVEPGRDGQSRLQQRAADILPDQDGWIVTTVIGSADVPPLVPDDRRREFPFRPPLSEDQSRADHGDVDHGADVLRGAPSGAAPRRSPSWRRPDRRRPGLFAATGAGRRAIRAAHLLEKRDYPTLDRTVPIAPTPIECRKRRAPTAGRAPLIGEHTGEILDRLGYTAAEITALQTEKVV